MDQATLVNFDVERGFKIIDALDAAHIKVNVAAWMFSEDYGDWRFILSSPTLNQTVMFEAYKQVLNALEENSNAWNSQFQFMIFPTKNAFIRELRKRYAKLKDATGMRFAGKIGDRFVSDGFICRIK